MSPLNGKVILVTGATGFIGKHLIERLCAEKDIHLLALSRQPVSHKGDDVTWVCSALDQLTSETWRKVDVDRIDIVFHLGAFTPKSGAEADQVEAVYRDNLWGTRALLDSLPSLPERIIFASTLDVYAPPTGDAALDEGSLLGSSGLYGSSKLFCEQLVRAYAKKLGFGYAILRYGHIFGPGEEAYAKLIPRLIRRLSQGDAPVLYGDGGAERDFLYVDDAVEATLRASVSARDGLGPVNIVRGESTPIRDIAETLVRITGFSGEIKYLKDKPKGDSLRFDNRLMREVLGKWNLISLEEGLKREVQYFRSLCL